MLTLICFIMACWGYVRDRHDWENWLMFSMGGFMGDFFFILVLAGIMGWLE